MPQIQKPACKADYAQSHIARQYQQVANLLAAGRTYAEIAKIIGKSVSRVGAIADELRGKPKRKKPSPKERREMAEPKPQPNQRADYNYARPTTHCTGEPGCRCLLHLAEAIKTPERIRMMHATDEVQRLEDYKNRNKGERT